MDKAKLLAMIAQVEGLLLLKGVDEASRKAYKAQIAQFRQRIDAMPLLEMFTRANKVGMNEIVSLRVMSAELMKAPTPEKQLAFVKKAAQVMKAFLA